MVDKIRQTNDNVLSVLPFSLSMIHVYSLPAYIEPEVLNDSVAVVIDVLRATTVITCAVNAGAETFIPVLTVDEAMQLKLRYPDGSVVLGGERGGLPVAGFDLGNSPQDYTPQRIAGKTLVITTTNGTVAIHAAQAAKKIILAAFVNAAAVVERIKDEDRIVIICAGTCGQETEEDLLLAGCLVARLHKNRQDTLNDTAVEVQRRWNESITALDLTELLRQSVGGQNLIRLGLEQDITFAAQLDILNTVAVVQQRASHLLC